MKAPAAEDLSLLSDEALIDRCRPNRFEIWLHGAGCSLALWTGLAASSAVAGLGFAQVVDWPWIIFLWASFCTFPCVALGAFGLFGEVVRRRRRFFLQELGSRCGLRSLEKDAEEARKSMSSTDVAIYFWGTTLPILNHWWIGVRLSEDRPGSVEVRFLSSWDFDGVKGFLPGQDPLKDFLAAQGEVPLESARRWIGWAGEIEMRKTEISSTVMDGFPVRCAVLSGAAGTTKHVECNLAGVPSKSESLPQIRLIHEVFEAGQALIEAQSGFGSCSFDGEIRIVHL